MSQLTFRLDPSSALDINADFLAMGLTVQRRVRVETAWTVDIAETVAVTDRAHLLNRLTQLGYQSVAWTATVAELQSDLVLQLKTHRASRLAHKITFAHAGKSFGAGTNSQGNWTSLAMMESRGHIGPLPRPIQWPITITTFDERITHDIADAAELDTMLLAAYAAIMTERAAAALVIASVLAAADSAAAQTAADRYLNT